MDGIFASVDQASGRAIWADVVKNLREDIGAGAYGKWISGLEFVAEIDDVIKIAAPSGLQRDRVNEAYGRKLNALWANRDPKSRRLAVCCWDDLPEDVAMLARAASAGAADAPVAEATEDQFDPINPDAPSFASLVVGDSNRIASTIARKLAVGEDIPARTVFVYGLHGTGKTHILHAIEAEARHRNTGRKVLYMSAEEFMVAYVEGVKRRDTVDLRSRLRSADLLLIDDLQTIAGMAKTQQEFFANIKAVVGRGGKVVITCDTSPDMLPSLDARIRGELQGGLSVPIDTPDEAMRGEIVRMKASLIRRSYPDFVLDDDSVDHILKSVRGPGRQLYGAVCNIHAVTTFVGRPVTFEDVRAQVQRQVGTPKPPTIDEIKRAVMLAFGVTKTDLESPSRARAVAYPRQIAMYLCRTLTARSLPQIGHYFGGRDHTTVLYAVRKITERVGNDPVTRADAERAAAAIDEVRGSRK